MIDDLVLFIKIVEAGSFSRAAQQLAMPPATLTRRLQKLEAVLNCQLLHRNPRGITLTQEGERYFERCQPLLGSLLQAVDEVHYDITEPSGHLRVLAPMNLAVSTLKAFWGDFLRRYPTIQLDLRLDNRNGNLLEQGADLALRVGKQDDSSLIQRRLTQIRTMGVIASPLYLENHEIHSPHDLFSQAWLLALPLSEFTLTRHEESVNIRPECPRLQVNEIRLCIELARQGLGLSYVPLNQCEDALNKGELIHVLPEWKTPVRDIYAVWHKQKQLPARVRVLVEALADYMENWSLTLNINDKVKQLPN